MAIAASFIVICELLTGRPGLLFIRLRLLIAAESRSLTSNFKNNAFFSGTAVVNLSNCDLHKLISDRGSVVTSGLQLFSPPVSDAVLDVLAPCFDYTDRVIRERRFVTSMDKKRRQSITKKFSDGYPCGYVIS